MGWIFLLCIILSSLAIRVLWRKSGRLVLDLGEWCATGLTAYCLIIFSALPLIWLDHWSIGLHTLTALCVGAFPILIAARRCIEGTVTFHCPLRISFGIFLVICGVGISLQWHSIYHLYNTHDPGAYLNATLNLHRTGSFFHRDEIVRIAFGDKRRKLLPLLTTLEAPEPWLAPVNYGTVPLRPEKGLSGFHGVLGTPLFLAVGIHLFGKEHCIRIHWIHLGMVVLLLAAITQHFLQVSSAWQWLAGLLFVISPLVSATYRHPLSEPLAQVFFLGMVFSCLKMPEKDHQHSAYLFLFCLVGALLTRVSSLMYLPFFVLACFLVGEKTLERRVYFWMSFVCLSGIGLATVLWTAPNYAWGLIHSYSELSKTFFQKGLHSPVVIAVAVLVSLLVAGAILLYSRGHRLAKQMAWKLSWISYFFVLFSGLLFVYGYGIFRWRSNYGGFPFVLYQPDSLFFYAGPLVFVLGFIKIFSLLYEKPLRELSFLQGYFPFAVFFHLIYSFGTLRLQPYLQRYLLLELVPLLIVGTTLMLVRWYQEGKRPLSRIAIVFCLAWSGFVTAGINHADICKGAFKTFEASASQLTRFRQAGHKPVLVVVKPSWRDLTFLSVFSNAYGFPVVMAYHGLNEKEKTAVDELFKLGYQPLLITGKAAVERQIQDKKRRWSRWASIQHCYKYYHFNLGAPPFELTTNCINLSILKPKL